VQTPLPGIWQLERSEGKTLQTKKGLNDGRLVENVPCASYLGV
jgi:hypothetical protein